MVKYLAIGPGAMGYFLFQGAVSHLAQAGRLVDLEEISGASAGATLAFLYVLTKGDTAKMLDSALDAPVQQAMKPNIKSLVKNYGLVPNTKVQRVLSNLCHKLVGKKDLTFQELYEWYPIKLHVAAFCVERGSTMYFSVDTSPTMSVVDAVTASMCIPFMVACMKIGDWTYIDGGAAERSPCGPFLGRGADVLAVILEDGVPPHISDVKSYAFAMLYSTMRLRHQYHVPTHALKDTGFNIFDFGMSRETKLRMFLSGFSREIA